MTCFTTYFSAVFIYLKNVYHLATHDFVAVGSFLVSAGIGSVSYILDYNFFGVSNHLLLLVMATVLFNTVYGIRKSLQRSKEAAAKAISLSPSSPEYRLQIKLQQRFQFDIKKLQFVFFKCFTLMGYLYFARTLLDDDGEGYLDLTAAILTKTPIAIFWYHEFKSIGENSTYIYKKKASIFTIVEGIFELRFAQYFTKNNKTPEL